MKREIAIASCHEIDSLAVLLDSLFSQDLEFEPDCEKQKRGLELILNNPQIGEILILKIDHQIAGMVSLLYGISTALGGRVAILEDMIIDAKFRNKGYGSELLSNAINHAQKNGCLRITLLTDFDNSTAIHFYQKFGFDKSQMIPLRKLL